MRIEYFHLYSACTFYEHASRADLIKRVRDIAVENFLTASSQRVGHRSVTAHQAT